MGNISFIYIICIIFFASYMVLFVIPNLTETYTQEIKFIKQNISTEINNAITLSEKIKIINDYCEVYSSRKTLCVGELTEELITGKKDKKTCIVYPKGGIICI